MIIAILILFTLIALAADYYILRRNMPHIKWLRILYRAQALILNIGVLLYLFISMFYNAGGRSGLTLAMLWVMLIYMMSFGAKMSFALFSLAELILSRIFGRRFRTLLYVGGAIIMGVIGVMIYGTTIGRTTLRVERVTIESSMLPEAFDGFTIAQFSDTHLGNLGDDSDLIERMVERINELDPDIVVQNGDLVNIQSDELTDKYMQSFMKLHAPVYSVLGNHDLAYYIYDQSITPSESIEGLISKQSAMGWHLLRNENRTLYRGGDSIVIAGAVYPQDSRLGARNNIYGGSDLRKTFEGVDDSLFSVLISHTPSLFDSIPEFVSPNLTLSGHVHSMQVKITIGDWKWSPAKWLYPMWSGLWVDRGHYLYINDGIGYVLYPMRIGVRPEITLLELKRIKK